MNSNVAMDDCALTTVTDSSAPHTGKVKKHEMMYITSIRVEGEFKCCYG